MPVSCSTNVDAKRLEVKYDDGVPHIKENLWSFYLEGLVDRLLTCDVDDVLAAVVESDLPVLQECHRIAALSSAAVAANSRAKRKWFDDHSDDFKSVAKEYGSCDENDAFAAWLEGRADKLTGKLMRRCANALYEEHVDVDEGDDDDDEDEDD